MGEGEAEMERFVFENINFVHAVKKAGENNIKFKSTNSEEGVGLRKQYLLYSL